MSQSLYAMAKHAALENSMAESTDVYLLGWLFGGITEHQSVFSSLQQKYPDRVWNPPSSELGMAGVAVGAALQGLRPVFDVITASFSFQAFAQIVNEAANVRYMSAGRSSAPVTFHMLGGIRAAGGAQHSQRLESMFWNTPGLEVLLPGTPQDVYELARYALLESEDPTVFIDHPLLLGTWGEFDPHREPLQIGKARVLREGGDATVVATSIMVLRTLEAAERLAQKGIEITVIDPRSVVPFDLDTIVESLGRTGRLVVADETNMSCGVAGEIIARVVTEHMHLMKAPPVRVTTPDVPVPYSPALEAALTPSATEVQQAVETALRE